MHGTINLLELMGQFTFTDALSGSLAVILSSSLLGLCETHAWGVYWAPLRTVVSLSEPGKGDSKAAALSDSTGDRY